MSLSLIADRKSRSTKVGVAGPGITTPQLTPAARLQRSFGNRATQSLTIQRQCACGGTCAACNGNNEDLNVQTKLAVHEPEDFFERQADGVAHAVVHSEGQIPEISPTPSGHVQTKSDVGGSAPVSPTLAGNIQAQKGSGSPLPSGSRTFLESRFQTNFEAVRIHTDAESARLNQSLTANAFTTGNDIFFASGKFQPESTAGQQLLAHELTHVVQQGAAGERIQREGIGDLRISEAYQAALAPIKSGSLYLALSAAEQTLVDQIVSAIEAKSGWPARYWSILKLQTLFSRTAVRAELDAARAEILTLGLDAAKLNALFATLAKPFLGYTASGFDFDHRFFQHSGKLGFTVENSSLDSYKPGGKYAPYDRNQPASVTDPAEKSFLKSDILFFSGHQYAQHREPGNFTDDSSESCFNIGMISKANKRVKLVVSTSCAVICKDVAKIWRDKFPDALILGYRFSAPKDGGKVADNFAAKIAKKGAIDLFDPSDRALVRQAWKDAVIAEGTLYGGPGLLDGSDVEIHQAGKWVTKPWDDKANDCIYHHH